MKLANIGAKLLGNIEELDGAASFVAPGLLGWHLVRELDGERLVARIVEVEAYDQTDAASHSYRGQTPRTDVMLGPAGRLYVYFTYGMHYCCNVVVGPAVVGAAVLIRAAEPLEGSEIMRVNRGNRQEKVLTNGPARLCQALLIDKKLNGHDLQSMPLQLVPGKLRPNESTVQTTRIGISRERETPWRFYIKDNPFVSKG